MLTPFAVKDIDVDIDVDVDVDVDDDDDDNNDEDLEDDQAEEVKLRHRKVRLFFHTWLFVASKEHPDSLLSTYLCIRCDEERVILEYTHFR